MTRHDPVLLRFRQRDDSVTQPIDPREDVPGHRPRWRQALSEAEDAAFFRQHTGAHELVASPDYIPRRVRPRRDATKRVGEYLVRLGQPARRVRERRNL